MKYRQVPKFTVEAHQFSHGKSLVDYPVWLQKAFIQRKISPQEGDFIAQIDYSGEVIVYPADTFKELYEPL